MVEKYTITKKDEVYNLLKDKRNFSLMEETLLRRLINEMKIVRFTEKTLLIKQEEENRFIYILIKGGLTVYVDKKPLYMLRRTGDVVGELSFVTKSPSTASVVAEPDTGVMAISFTYLKKMNDMEFALWLSRIIGDKLIRTSKLKTAEGVVPQKPAVKPPAKKKAKPSPPAVEKPSVEETPPPAPVNEPDPDEAEMTSATNEPEPEIPDLMVDDAPTEEAEMPLEAMDIDTGSPNLDLEEDFGEE